MKKTLFLFVIIFTCNSLSYSQQKRGKFGISGGINVSSQTYFGGEIGLTYLHTISLDNRSNYPIMLLWTSIDVGIDYNWKQSEKFNRANLNLAFNLNNSKIVNPSFGISAGIENFNGRTYFTPSPQIGVCYNNVDVKNPISFNLYYRLNPLIGDKSRLINEIGFKFYATIF